jgi:hypothetical protein
MDSDKSVTAKFSGVAGFRSIRVENYTGSMTIVPAGSKYVGVLRDSSSSLAYDLDGQMVGPKLTINMRLLNTALSPSTIDCNMASGGTLTGTFSEPGDSPRGFNADAPTATEFSDEAMGYWRATVDGYDARLAICQRTDGSVRGTALIPVQLWDPYYGQYITYPIGLDVEGSISGSSMLLTLSAGAYNFTISTDLANGSRWQGQINGGDFANAPFVAER